MKIIRSNDMLRRYMPNVLRSVAGEPSLLEKILPVIAEAEEWLEKELAGKRIVDKLSTGDENDRMFMQAAQIIVYKAMSTAVPSLDLVLTPNGFGVVSNANIAPASKDRVERLASSLTEEWQKLATEMLDDLRGNTLWHDSPQFLQWSALLVSPRGLSRFFPEKQPLTSYALYKSDLAMLERLVVRNFLGEEYLSELRRGFWTDSISAADSKIISDVNVALARSLKGGAHCLDSLSDTVWAILASPSDYPTWHTSRIAEIYKHKPFTNKKENHGYFF